MSGRKCSQVELNAARQRALDNNDGAMVTARRCKERIAEFQAALDAESDVPKMFRELLVKLHRAAEKAKQHCDLAREALRDPSLTLSTIERQQEENAECALGLEILNRQVGACLSGLGIETRCEAFLARVENERDRFRLWLAERYDGLVRDMRSLHEDLRNTLGRGQGVEGFTKRLDQIIRQWEMLVGEIQQREHQNHRRDMVIESIRDCCQTLGYTVERRQQSDPNRAVELVVDTQLYGEILFTLELDGLLRSLSDVWLEEQEAEFEGSEAEQTPCTHWVNELTDKMKDGYGMQLAFQFEDSGKPVDQSRTSKGMPVQKPQGQAAEGHSGA